MAKNIQNLLLRYTTLIMFVLLVFIFALLAPRFFGLKNILNIIKQASFVGIVAVGMIFVLLTAGIDLSVGAVMYLAPLIAGFAMRSWGIGVFPALLICLLAGLVMGAINAFFIVRLNIIPFIVTLSEPLRFSWGRYVSHAVHAARFSAEDAQTWADESFRHSHADYCFCYRRRACLHCVKANPVWSANLRDWQ